MSQLDSDKISQSAIQASLSDIENYVLWNAINIVHHENNVRPNIDKSKVEGQSGSRADLYQEYGIDKDSIVSACISALDL